VLGADGRTFLPLRGAPAGGGDDGPDGAGASGAAGSSSCPPPPPARVRWAQRREYVAAALHARAAENAPALAALRRGLADSVPPPALALLTWRDAAARVCGVAEWSVDELRALTKSEASGSAERRVVDHFWAAMGTFTHAERAAVLAFATGRSRLPRAPPPGSAGEASAATSSASSSRPRHVLLLDVLGAHAGADALPTASTCSFALHLPRCSDAAAMARALRIATTWSGAIDGDGTRVDGHLFQMLDAAPVSVSASASSDGGAVGGGASGGAWLLRPLFVAAGEGDDDAAADDGADGGLQQPRAQHATGRAGGAQSGSDEEDEQEEEGEEGSDAEQEEEEDGEEEEEDPFMEMLFNNFVENELDDEQRRSLEELRPEERGEAMRLLRREFVRAMREGGFGSSSGGDEEAEEEEESEASEWEEE
jgi:hypothetical protein